jgi:hypothetical protein
VRGDDVEVLSSRIRRAEPRSTSTDAGSRSSSTTQLRQRRPEQSAVGKLVGSGREVHDLLFVYADPRVALQLTGLGGRLERIDGRDPSSCHSRRAVFGPRPAGA